MKRNVLSFVNKLQSYKTAIKNLHWSSKNMSEHKLWDDIADSVANIQDEVAEIAQGLFGKIKPNELKPRRYNITNSKKTLNDILKDTKVFYSTIKRGETFVGIRSSVEAFMGEMEKFKYLMDMCIKEDIRRNMKESLNESKQQTSNKVKLTENQLKNLIREAIFNVFDYHNDNNTNNDMKEIEKDASWDAFERTRQPKSKYSIQGNLDTYLDDKDSWYEFGKDKYDDVMDSDRSYEDKMDDFMDDYHEFSKEDDGFNGMQAQKSEPFYKTYYQDRYDKSKQKQRDLEQYI